MLPEAVEQCGPLRGVAVQPEVLDIEERLARDERLERRKDVAAVQSQRKRVVAHVERVVVGAEADVVPAACVHRTLRHLVAVHVLGAREEQCAAERAGVRDLHLWSARLRVSRPRLTRGLHLGFELQTLAQWAAQARDDRGPLIAVGLEVGGGLAEQQPTAGRVVAVGARERPTDGQPLTRRDRVIEFRQQCRHVVVPGILAFEPPEIGNPEFRYRDTANTPRKLHRQRRRLALQVHGTEVERPVRHERTAQASPGKVPNETGRRIPECVGRGEGVMTQRVTGRAVPRVGARFRHHVHQPASGPAGLDTQPRGGDLERRHRLERDREVLPFDRPEELAEEVVREIGPVHIQREVVARLAGHTKGASCAGDRFCRGRQQREAAVVVAVQGETRNGAGVEGGAQRGRGISCRGDGQCLGEPGEAHHEVHGQRLADAQPQWLTRRARKAGPLRLYDVDARRQERCREPARVVGDPHPLDTSGALAQGDGDARERRPRLVANRAGHVAAVERLRVYQRDSGHEHGERHPHEECGPSESVFRHRAVQ